MTVVSRGFQCVRERQNGKRYSGDGVILKKKSKASSY